MATTAFVQRAYLAYFGRPVDFTGTTAFISSSDLQVQNAFSVSAESQALYGSTFGAAQINAIYQVLFGRAAEPAGLAYWSNQVQLGLLTPAGAAIGILNGALNADAIAITNKLDASAKFTAAIDTTAEILGYSGNIAAASARSFLATVTATAATQAQIDAGVVVAVGAGSAVVNAGTTFTLTTGSDNIVGNSANNIIDGSRIVLQGQIVDSLNNADSIDGDAGTDTLIVQFTGSNTVTTPSSLRNVEIISVEAMNSGGATLNLINGDALVTTVRTANNAGAVVVSNIQSAPTAFEVSTTSAAFTASVATARLAGTADAASLLLTNVTGAAIAIGNVAATGGNGYETISIASAGTIANSIALDDTPNANAAGSLATINVAGANNLTLASAGGMTTVTRVDASTLTGTLTYTAAAANAQAMTVIGGLGNDVIDVQGYTSTDIINGGAGIDRLILTNAEATGAITAQSNVTNVEVIALSNGLTGAVSVTNFGANTLRLGANLSGASTVAYTAGTNGLDLQTFNGDALTATVAGVATNDVLNVTVGSATAANTGSTHAITINGAETVNLLSQGAANTFGAGFSITDTAANQAIVITGNQSITFTGAVRADSIDASALTGSATLTLTGGTGTTATIITGTANIDVLNGSTVGDIINGGAGADAIANTVTGTTAASAADVITGGAGFDTITLRGDTASGAVATILNTTSLITDFVVGSSATTTDILALSATSTNYANAATGLNTSVAAVAAGSGTVQTVAQNAAAAALVTGTDVIKLTTGVATTGLTLQTAFNNAIGTGTVTGLGAGNEIFFTLYDTTNARMLVGVVDAGGTNTIVETADVVSLVGSISMTATDYASFNANNFSIISA